MSANEDSVAQLTSRHAKQLDKTTEIEILKADLEERGFNIKVSSTLLT
jgi:hypothetical protein